MDIILIAKYLGMASAIVGACSVLWLKVLKPFGLFFTGLYSQWNRMVAELTPNGGSSMKHALGRIETRQLIEVQVRKALNNDGLYGIWEADTDGKCTYANRTYQRIVGRNFEDLEGWGWVNAIHPDDRATVVASWKSALEDKREFGARFRVMRPDSELNNVVSVGHPLKDRNGTLKGFVGQLVISDQTDDVFFSNGD